MVVSREMGLGGNRVVEQNMGVIVLELVKQ
jgi:hypothetical protein